MKCARRSDNVTKSYELMENPILFPLGIFPASIRHIVESLQKYEHYQVDFTAVSFSLHLQPPWAIPGQPVS